MSFEDAFLNVGRQIAALMKKWEDESLSWTYEETAMLSVDFGKEGRKEFYAETHREPVMGFSPKKEIITVRLFSRS